MGLTIIHLISDQTLQNVLPVAALNPTCVIQVRSDTEHYQRIAKNTEDACRRVVDYPIEISEQVITSEHPGVFQTSRTLRDILQRLGAGSAGIVYINLTGGTKAMSIGAYEMAKEFDAIPFYCDTRRRRIDAVNVEDPESSPLGDFEAAAQRLTVSIVLAAHGKAPSDHWKSNTLLSPELESFGKEAFRIREANNRVISSFVEGNLRRRFVRNGRFIESREQLLEELSKPLDAGEAGGPLESYLVKASEAGLLRQDLQGWMFHVDNRWNRKELRSRTETAFKELSGLWFERYCHSLLRQSRRFRDVHANVEPVGSSEDSEFGETDFVCFDETIVGITVISCKARKPSLEHIEAVGSRAGELGGSHARAVICCFVPDLSPDEIRRAVERAKRMRVTMVCNRDIEPFLLGTQV